MKIAILQCNPVTGDIEGNARSLLEAGDEAARGGANLCVAPELALSGHNALDLFLRNDLIRECRDTLQAMARHLAEGDNPVPLLLGAPIANPDPQGKPLQNCAVLLDKGRVIVVSRKVLLPSGGGDTEWVYFQPGVSCGLIEVKGWRMGVAIGEDAWNDRTYWQDKRPYDHDPVAELMGAAGADALINITALPYARSLPAEHQRMLAWSAARYHCPIISAHLVGGNDDKVYYGGSFALDAEGNLLARSPAFQEDVLLVDIDQKSKASISACPQAEEEIWKAAVMGTGDFVRKLGFRQVAVGLSGGVDSALVTAIAVEAVGPEQVTALLMPSPFSSEGSVADARELALNLGIRSHVLPISPMLQAYTDVFEGEFPAGMEGMAGENIQARIRGALLMAYSNRYGALILNTGNKSEEAVGYCTLYGDTVGGLAPIADLYKREVYALCRWYNSQGKGPIPEAILSKAPSAELRPGQKDSDTLPAYEILDPLLYAIIEEGQSRTELVDNGADPDLVDRVLALIRGAEFKRRQSPPGLKLSSRGFGNGWLMPIARGGSD